MSAVVSSPDTPGPPDTRDTRDTALPAGSRIDGLFPGEVVTLAHVRDVQLPSGTFALITLDNGLDHTRPSTFGPAGLTGLAAAVSVLAERAARDELVGVGITGKPYVFAVGADLTGVPRVTRREQALAIGRLGHATFGALSALPVPTFAFVNGAAMGGGVELPLHCTYRTISSGVRAVALPECFLGLVPGWGGCFLLPNLIGIEAALRVVIANPLSNNRMLDAPQALELGIADAMFEPADFLERSLEWADGVIAGRTPVPRPEIDRDPRRWSGAVTHARGLVDARLNGAAPAPYRALQLLEAARTADRDEAFAAEDDALADLLMGQELRASMYAFDLVQRRAKRPAGAPDASLARPVTKVGVVGAGLMAAQLALLFARRLEVPVLMTDLDQSRVDGGVARVHGELDTLRAKGRLTPDCAARLKALVTGSTSKDGFADADLVIEAVFEDLEVKAQVLAEVEDVVSPECILATNTSSLSVTRMASELRHPERVVGFHFFNPVAVMPLVEVVRAERTNEVTLATAFALGRTLKKSCVLVKDATAFVVNRLLFRMMSEITSAVDEGADIEVADSALRPLGLPMSPFQLLRLVGPAIALHVGETLHAQYPERFAVSPNLARLVAAGKRGIWSEAGPGPDGHPYVDEETRALLQQGSTPLSGEQVRARALAALAQEVKIMLDEGVVAAVADIDLCMILGAGWPFHLGGITAYLDREGVSEKENGTRFLPPGVHTLPNGLSHI